MSRRSGVRGRRTWRIFAAITLAYALVFQGFFAPIARLRAAELAQLNAALGIICSPSGEHGSPGQGDGMDCRDLPCCLPAARLQFDLSVVLAVSGPVLPAVDAEPAPLALERPQSRAPPPVAANPLQPRAPPATLV